VKIYNTMGRITQYYIGEIKIRKLRIYGLADAIAIHRLMITGKLKTQI
jgi:hypothetical protein